MTRFVGDSEARQLALREFERPVAIEAGAGTGKTRTLVARIGSWLLGRGWERAETELRAERTARGEGLPLEADVAARACDGLVAITFTDAAAAEMAARVDALLSEAAGGDRPRDLDGWPSGVGEDLLPQRAAALLAAASRLRLSTIHGFCHRLLAEAPLEAGLHPSFEIDPEGERTLDLATVVLLARLRGGSPELVELLAAGVDPPELLEALAALATAGVAAEELARDPFSRDVVALRYAALARALDALAAVAAPLVGAPRAGGITDALEALARLRRSIDDAAASAEGLIALAPALDEAAASAPKILDKWARGEVGKTEEKLLGGGVEELIAAAARVAYEHEALRSLDPRLTRLAFAALREPLSELHARRRAEGWLGFDDLLERATGLLIERPGVRARVRRGIRQLLVDEFQDTDRRQCDLLRALVLAPADAPPPGLFVVGDPKQSIYGWRSADLAAYAGFLDDLVAADGRFGRLDVNYRSQPPILAEVERALAPVLIEERGVQAGFQPLRPAPRHEGGSGFVEAGRAAVEYWDSSDPVAAAEGRATSASRAAEIEAEAIARDVRELVAARHASWGDFGLLLRARGDLDVYLDAMRRAGVPYAVQKDRSYYRRREVVDAAAAVRAILDPDDLLAAVAFLRSPFVGVPDAAWLPLWRAGFPRAWIAVDGERGLEAARAAIEAAAADEPAGLPKSAHAPGWAGSLVAAVEAVAALRDEFRRLPAGEWVERLRTRLLLEPIAAARFLGRFGLANLERFLGDLERALAREPDPGRALAALRRAIAEERPAEEARPPEEATDAVAVMTIHTAKGLQFRHVYLAQTQKQSGGRGGRGLPVVAVGPPPADRSPREMVLFGAPTPGWSALEAARRRVATAESARLLYVASTRAIDRLVICGRWDAVSGRRRIDAVPSFAELLAARRAEAPALSADEPAARDARGVLWRWAGLAATPATPAPPPAARPEEEPPFDLAALTKRRDAARARADRPRFESASRLAAQDPPAAPAAAEDRVARAVARALGVGLHRALELGPLAAIDEPEWRRLVLSVTGAALDAAGVADPAAALAQLEARLATLRASRLWELLSRLEVDRRVVARELPVLVARRDDPPTGGAPTDGVVGTLDLLYRAAQDDSFVVADFKSDGLDDTPAAVDAIQRRYRPQLELYGRAVRDALGLAAPPRLELWLLALDRVVELAPEPAADSG